MVLQRQLENNLTPAQASTFLLNKCLLQLQMDKVTYSNIKQMDKVTYSNIKQLHKTKIEDQRWYQTDPELQW